MTTVQFETRVMLRIDGARCISIRFVVRGINRLDTVEEEA